MNTTHRSDLYCSKLHDLGRQLIGAYDPLRGNKVQIAALQRAITQHRAHCPLCSRDEAASLGAVQNVQRLQIKPYSAPRTQKKAEQVEIVVSSLTDATHKLLR